VDRKNFSIVPLKKRMFLLFLLIPFGFLVLSVCALLVYCVEADKTPTYVFRTIFDRENLAKELAAPTQIPLDTNESFENNPFTTDATLSQLDNDAHRAALQTWSDQNNLTFDGNYAIAGSDTQCRGADRVDLTGNNDFVVWADNQCLITYGNGNICQNSDLPYVQAQTIKCTEDGESCSADDFPTCLLTRQYCHDKGIEYDSGNRLRELRLIEGSHVTSHTASLGDCYITDAQSVTEALFGETITRQVKGRVQRLLKVCRRDGPTSGSCLKAVLALDTVGLSITFDSVVKGYKDDVKRFKETCLTKPSNGSDIVSCIFSTLEFFPEYWLFNEANVLLNSILSIIPGMPHIDFLVFDAIIKYSGKVLDAVYKFGSDAGHACVEAGQSAIKMFEDIWGGDLVDFTLDSHEFVVAVDDILEAGKNAAINVVKVGIDAAEAVIRNGKKVIVVITLAIFHGGIALGKWVSRHLREGGLEQLAAQGEKLGNIFGIPGRDYTNALIAVGGAVASVGKSLGETFGIVDGAYCSLFCL
jgi:hypothetical protein